MIINTRVIFSPMCLPSMATPSRRRILSFPFASTDYGIDTDQLRTQLDKLHAEAENTQRKANNARMRLMRLSEAAENLQRGAADHVLVGKEIEARDMLIQRKKVMQALEKSKSRVEVLDELRAKLNEVISYKESQLIENVSMAPEFSRGDPSHQIRHIYPKDVFVEDSGRMDALDSDCTEPSENQELEVQSADSEQSDMEEAASIDSSINDNVINSFKNLSSCKKFLQKVDVQLGEVETDLVEFLRLPTMVSESEHEDMNIKLQQATEILQDICNIRIRISRIIDGN